MLNIDTSEMLIELTRGDTASIVFSAVTKEGEVYVPHIGEKLKFAVAKKVGAEPMFEITNIGDATNIIESTEYVESYPTQEEYEADPTKYYTESGGEYTQCSALDPYDSDAQYYEATTVTDATIFWTIIIGGNNEWYEKDADGNVIVDADGNKTDLFKFSDYVWDLQLTTSTGVDTIIGKTDDISPTFRVLGEVATE